MKLVVLREQLGAAEQDVLAGMASWTQNDGRRLMQFLCDEVFTRDPYFVEARYVSAQGQAVSLWIPNPLVLYIVEVGASPPASMGFVGPPLPEIQTPPPAPAVPDTKGGT
jgi:hypothetical protein